MPLITGKPKERPGFKPRMFDSLPGGYMYLHQLPARAEKVMAGGWPVKLYKANVFKDASHGKIPGAIRVRGPTGRPRWAAPKKSGDRLISSIATRHQELADAAAAGWMRRAALADELDIDITNLNNKGKLKYRLFGDEAHIAPEDVESLRGEAARLPSTVSLKYLAGISGFGRKRITKRVSSGVLKTTAVFGEKRLSIPDSIESVQKRIDSLRKKVKDSGALAYRNDRTEIVFLENLLTRFKQLQQRAKSGSPYVGGTGRALRSMSSKPLTPGARSALFKLRRAEMKKELRRARHCVTQAERNAVLKDMRQRADEKAQRAAKKASEKAVTPKPATAAKDKAMTAPAAKAEIAKIDAELKKLLPSLYKKQVKHAELGEQFKGHMDKNGYWAEGELPESVKKLLLQRNSVAEERNTLSDRADTLKERRRALAVLLASNKR